MTTLPLQRRLWHRISDRVGFWRALLDATLLISLISLLPYVLAIWIGSPWLELISYSFLSCYVYAAWRLAPGLGSIWQRLGRFGLWLGLFVLLNGTISWLILRYLPEKGDFLGMNLSEVELSYPSYMFSALMLIVGMILPVRLLIDAWDLGRRRLRWRLTFSYLLIGVLTNLLVPVSLLLYLSLFSLTSVPPIVSPSEINPRLSAVIAETLDNPNVDLQVVLEGLLNGDTRLPMDADSEIADPMAQIDATVRRISILYDNGVMLASAGEDPWPIGSPPSQQLQQLIALPAAQAISNNACAGGHPADGMLADLSVCVLRPAADGAALLLLVESRIDDSIQVGAAFGRIVSLTLIGSSFTLSLSLLVVLALLPIALGGGYLLARQLTRRVERLQTAATALSTGKLDQPVLIDTADEIGQLSASFNRMAAQLAEREQALAAAAARAEELLRANRRLVADVSHELRNPLATLRGYLEALEQNHGAQLPAHDMHVIGNEMQRLTGLVDDLFTLARAEARQLPLNFAAVDAAALMQRLADTFAPLAKRERQIEVVAQIAPNLPKVRADVGRLEQVIRNLAQNALRHTPAGGIIVLAAESAGDAVVLTVADTGIGIDPDDLPHVFERFYRGDSSRTRETGGAGLGLALVHELITAMGGSIAVDSHPGRGSRFTIHVPTD